MPEREAPLTDAQVAVNWSGVAAYPPYSLPHPTLVGSDPVSVLSDASNGTYIGLSWGLGLEDHGTDIDPFPPGMDALFAGYGVAFPNMGHSGSFDGWDSGRGYRLFLTFAVPDGGVPSRFLVTAAFDDSDPTVPTGFSADGSQSPGFAVNGFPNSGVYVPELGDTLLGSVFPITEYDSAFRTYEFSASPGDGASSGGSVFPSALYNSGVEGDSTDWWFRSKVSRVRLFYRIEGVDGDLTGGRRVMP